MFSHIDDLVAAMTDLARSTPDPEHLAQRTSELLSSCTAGATWIPEEFTECRPDCYQARQVHIDPEGAFSICIMAWLPGQRTPIHDHIAWCVVSVCRGSEIEEQFDLTPTQEGLLRRGSSTLLPGDTVVHWPIDGDIHRVTCAPGSPAISIHVYGCDISIPGTSIRTSFDELPVAGGEREQLVPHVTLERFD